MTSPTIAPFAGLPHDALPDDALPGSSSGDQTQDETALPDPIAQGISPLDSTPAGPTGGSASGSPGTGQGFSGGYYTPQGSGNLTVGQKIVQSAEHYLGTPYVWGGEGANGMDCSGLVQAAYKAAGISLPRISFQQANAGKHVSSMKQLRPGDLIAWDNSTRNVGADHIAIYLGNGQIIEAPHPGASVRIRSLGAHEGAWFIRMGW
jgi:cell wall-associated NlpC family hydrolase